jgi:hypothetical protein
MYYVWCMCGDCVPYHELFMYFDMYYIQWHHLPNKDLWNKAYILFYSITLQTNWLQAILRDCWRKIWPKVVGI